MGLLDAFDSPQGRLGLSLLSAAGPSLRPMSFGQRLGMGMNQFDQWRNEQEDREEKKRLLDAKLAELMSLAEARNAQAEEVRSRRAAEQEAQRMRGNFLGSVDESAGPAMPMNIPRALSAGLNLGEIGALMPPKPEKPQVHNVAPGHRLVVDGREVFFAPDKPEAKPEALRALAQVYGEGSPQYIAAAKQYADKLTTHAPASSQTVTMGTPVEVDLGDGQRGFIQPSNRPGEPPRIIRLPKEEGGGIVRPPPPKLGETATKQVAGIDALGGAIDSYVKRLSSWSNRDLMNVDKINEIGTLYNNVLLQAKEAYNLGVLNGPDYQILQSVVRNPVSFAGAISSNESLANQANTLKRLMNKTKSAVTKSQGTKDNVLRFDASGNPIPEGE